MTMALEESRSEKLARKDIEAAASSASVFEKYGIL